MRFKIMAVKPRPRTAARQAGEALASPPAGAAPPGDRGREESRGMQERNRRHWGLQPNAGAMKESERTTGERKLPRPCRVNSEQKPAPIA